MLKHYPLTPDLAKKLRNAQLTAAEWRLWSYLVTLDPFGDRYEDMPDLLTIKQECDISKSAFYRAIAKFQDHELFDTQPVKIAFRNLQGARKILTENSPKNGKVVPELGIQSQNWESSPKNETLVPELGTQSQNWENPRSQPAPDNDSETLQIDQTDQTLKTLSHAHPPTERELLDFTEREIKKDKAIRQPRAYAKQALKEDREIWIEKYQKWESQRVEIDPSAAAPPSTDFVAPTIDELRDRYLSMWQTPQLRGQVKKRLAEMPELNLQIIGEELRRVEPALEVEK
jgi:hypothetical protein